MSRLLEVANLQLSYGRRIVLRSATFSARSGEFLALVGVNGAGKSTLLDMIAGFRKPAAGSISIAGRDQKAWDIRELSQRVSHLPQAVHADLPYMAEQLVAMGRYPHTDRWFESAEDHSFIREAMERTHCWNYRHRNFRSLSGGERQRVLLAACLAQNASILLLDEPSTFLDIEQQLHCFTVLREEAKTGKLCIVVTHDLNLALTHCSRVLVLADGIVAHDLSTAKAQENDEWLVFFLRVCGLAVPPQEHHGFGINDAIRGHHGYSTQESSPASLRVRWLRSILTLGGSWFNRRSEGSSSSIA